ncbi:DMT family transporter [Leucobacter sp. W1478]|uniref:DMT family transporter n=1 Tax=Leucobacter sp. W1478 TaxID=3439065 RepID=UPI003F38A2C6
MTPGRQSVPVWAALVGSGLAGTLVALQSRINGGLSQQLGNGFVTAAVSFGSGLIIMVLAVVFSPRGRRGIHKLRVELASKHLPLWALTGGLCGAFFVLGQGLVASVIGLALFTVGIVGGQVLGGLLIDRVGLGPGGKVRPSPQRIVGTVLAVVAVGLSVLTDLAATGSEGPRLWLVLIPVAAGLAIAWQSAVNGRVRSAAQSASAATFVNFLVGTAVLLLAAAVSVGVQGWPETWPSEPWYYVGGFIGTIFIGVAAMLVRAAGVLLLSMSNVAGQLVASVALDASIPLAGGVTPGLLAGAAVALLAVTIAALPRRSSRG